MSWKVKVHEDWEKELTTRYEDYGPRFREEVSRWLNAVSRGAVSNQQSAEFSRLDRDLEDIHADKIPGWKHFWQKWRKEPLLTRIGQLLAVLRTGEPPIELWASDKLFDVATCFPARISTIFAVDKLKKTITFVWFDGLPGHGAKD